MELESTSSSTLSSTLSLTSSSCSSPLKSLASAGFGLQRRASSSSVVTVAKVFVVVVIVAKIVTVVIGRLGRHSRRSCQGSFQLSPATPKGACATGGGRCSRQGEQSGSQDRLSVCWISSWSGRRHRPRAGRRVGRRVGHCVGHHRSCCRRRCPFNFIEAEERPGFTAIDIRRS